MQFALFSLLAGFVGWFASFELLTEYIKTLTAPGYIPNCSISKLVTCGPNMESRQGSVFGFSNTIIGVSAFTVPIFMGAALVAGATMRRWFWAAYNAGLLGGTIFVTWLQYQSFFALGTLCPWCIVIWVTQILLWWITFFRSGSLGHFSPTGRPSATFSTLKNWTWVVVSVHLILVAAVAQFALDWLMEFRL